MNKMKWFGLLTHLLLGALFPFVLVGCIVLIYGFMAPPTHAQRLTGIALVVIYWAILIGINMMTLRRLLTAKDKWYWLLKHVMVWGIACILMFVKLRISG